MHTYVYTYTNMHTYMHAHIHTNYPRDKRGTHICTHLM